MPGEIVVALPPLGCPDEDCSTIRFACLDGRYKDCFAQQAMNLWPAAEEFEGKACVGRLATTDEHGRPHVVPVCFVYQDGLVYSLLDSKPKRVTARQLRRVRKLLARLEVQIEPG